LPTPKWQTRASGFPLLSSPELVGSRGLLDFGGKADREMATFAYATRPGSVARFVGVAVPKGAKPSAYLIYFRHTAQDSDYPGGAGLLEMGIGDYFEGRLQVCRQVSASGRTVAVILPIAPRTSGEFETDAAFVSQCLKEIRADLFGGADAPLLLACNSDGILKMDRFIQNCRALIPRVRAIYDLDGSYVKAAKSITLIVDKVRVFRYEQTQLILMPGETLTAHLTRKMAMNPAHVPLPHPRWISYSFYPPAPPDGNWLHHYIPTCMLHHGLTVTNGI
jgi:hypothetical protein